MIVPVSRIIAALVAGLCLAGCLSPASQEAADLLADIAAGDGPSRFKSTTAEPIRRTIQYRRSAGAATADLYQPAAPASGAVVVVPGLTPAGKDDQRLVGFARSLARARFLVLVPEVANTRKLKVSGADQFFIADAVEELAQRFAGGHRRIGLVAISYSVGPALLAAAETPAGRHLRFIVAIGGYYDIDAAIGFVTTGAYRSPDGSWRQGVSNAFGKYVFLNSNAERVGDPGDRARLTAIAERRLRDPEAEVGELTGRLRREGRAVWQLIANPDPQRVGELIAELPTPIRSDLRALDLKGRDFGALHGPVFLIHGEDDAIIPAGESVRLAAALGARAELTLIEHFAHVDTGAAGLGDSLRLLHAATRVLEERDRR